MKIKMRNLIILILAAMIVIAFCWVVNAQFYQKADYGDKSITRTNQLGGYDYYDDDGNKIGYSKKTYGGDYIYYDNAGNQVGVLKQNKRGGGYTFYDADNIAAGTLRKTPTGEYRYTDRYEGGLRSVTPPPGEGIGFVPPETFLEGTTKTQLEGTFKDKTSEE